MRTLRIYSANNNSGFKNKAQSMHLFVVLCICGFIIFLNIHHNLL